jgi:integrase
VAGKASENRFRFTKARIDTLPVPEAGKRANWYDERRPELALRVTSAGAKTFYVIRRMNGVPKWFKLGTYPTMTIEQALTAATRLLGEVANGVDPAQARRTLRGEPTLDEFFIEYWEKHARHKDSGRDDQQRYATHIKPYLGSRKLSQVTEDDAKAVADRMARAGLSGATINRVKALFHVMFKKASDWKVCIRPNPADAIERRAEKSRKRFLRGDEIPAFFAALATLPEQSRNFDFHEKIWRIPDTKNGEPHEVPLTDDALEILISMREQRTASPFVFPGKGVSGHLVEPKRQWNNLLEAAGINDFHIHDLRRTLGSWQAKSGVSLATIGKTLGHKTLQTTLVYARLDTDPVRQAMQTANDAIKAAAGMGTTESSDS